MTCSSSVSTWGGRSPCKPRLARSSTVNAVPLFSIWLLSSSIPRTLCCIDPLLVNLLRCYSRTEFAGVPTALPQCQGQTSESGPYVPGVGYHAQADARSGTALG